MAKRPVIPRVASPTTDEMNRALHELWKQVHDTSADGNNALQASSANIGAASAALFSTPGGSLTSGGSWAPVTASYITVNTEPVIGQARKLAVEASLTLTDAGAGSTYTVGFATTQPNAHTWNATQTFETINVNTSVLFPSSNMEIINGILLDSVAFQNVNADSASRVYVIPKGSPVGGATGVLKVFGTDYIADSTNYLDLGIYYDQPTAEFRFNSKKGGSYTNPAPLTFTSEDATYVSDSFAQTQDGSAVTYLAHWIGGRDPGTITKFSAVPVVFVKSAAFLNNTTLRWYNAAGTFATYGINVDASNNLVFISNGATAGYFPSGGGSFVLAGYVTQTGIAAPSSPSAGKVNIYADSTSKVLAAKNDAGTISHTVQTKVAVASNFLTAIADDGTVSAVQPAFSDISGTATVAQLPVFVASGASHAAGIVPDPGASAGTTKFLREDATWAIPPTTALADPTSSVGLTAVNGAATTAMRSDAAPALDQSIAPTWTSKHIWAYTSTSTSGTVNDLSVTMTANPGSASTSGFRGASFLSQTQAALAFTVSSLTGLRGEATHQGAATISTLEGIRGQANITSTGGSSTAYSVGGNISITGAATITTALAGRFSTTVNAAASINTLAGVQIIAPSISGGATITTVVGLDIGNQSGGTNNYAIRTGTGAVQFGDNVTGTGGLYSSSATAGIGYSAGAGGTATQLTSKSTGVTLNKATGQITMNNASLAANTTVSFVLTNSAIASTDILVMNHISGGTPGSYTLNAQAASGSATINVRNVSTGALGEAIVIAFAVVKAVTA